MSTYRSVLVPERQSLALYVLLALFAHVFVTAVGVTASDWVQHRRRPLIDPAEAMTVELKILPKAKTDMPDRAMRAPKPRGQESAPPPVEQPDTPPPVHSSDLTVSRPDAEPAPQGAPDQSAERQARMRELLMSQLSDDAPEGPVDQVETDPNSTSDEAINAGGAGARGDPELARYVSELRTLFLADFHPLPTIVMANPDISCTVHIEFDLSSGQVLGVTVEEPSGNALYDSAAERAAQAVRQVPAPPEQFHSHFRHGLSVVFEP